MWKSWDDLDLLLWPLSNSMELQYQVSQSSAHTVACALVTYVEVLNNSTFSNTHQY